jgi:hypothetical protein
MKTYSQEPNFRKIFEYLTFLKYEDLFFQIKKIMLILSRFYQLFTSILYFSTIEHFKRSISPTGQNIHSNDVNHD